MVGKKINFKFELEGEETPNENQNPSVALKEEPVEESAKDLDFNVFMKCTRLSQGGGSTPGYYYDYSKRRTLSYNFV